ncbi:P-loop containing nucleoside triphosphate hydrolase protein [Dactylonectria estremocensis]|uniref:P-loop containing nucleoside triphosphate hydrolase protein n=1 Tax=Dactylonectria estremocensis TaxID=1079267 RepID=A0A9P9EUW0_9HYPO|nr:P-loop containing nucleoside triphosphate hydrolase protein [Dactylonectria estremocensis]
MDLDVQRRLRHSPTHCIRNDNTEFLKAAESLDAERRWCLSGTPIQTSLHDLRSLMKFLRHAPLMSSKPFEKHIIDPTRNESKDQDQFRNPRLLLHAICLRRSEECLNLPPSVTETIPVVQTEQESAEYQIILENCQNELCNRGTVPQATPSQKPLLLLNRKPWLKKVLLTLGNEICECCSDTEGNMETFDGIDGCPMIAVVTPSSRTSSASPISNEASMIETSGYSSKLTAVAQNLEISCKNFNSKSVVFSSLRLTLDTLGRVLLQRGITLLRIDGRVKPADRTAIMSRFRKNPEALVLLMTIDSVHLIEPHWNPAMEAQAIARVLRMGQKQTVTIVKYVTEKTVE